MGIIIAFFVILAFAIVFGYFVVRGRNAMQAQAMADELEKRKKAGTL